MTEPRPNRSNELPDPDRDEIIAIGEGFLTRTFPGERFHHREHLITTAFLLVEHPLRNWRRELPDLIRAYNVAQGGVNDDTRGYHHTITMAYLDLVTAALEAEGSMELEAACNAVLKSPAADDQILLRFYSRDRLFSREARMGLVEPDLMPISLPEPAVAQQL